MLDSEDRSKRLEYMVDSLNFSGGHTTASACQTETDTQKSMVIEARTEGQKDRKQHCRSQIKMGGERLESG